MLQPPVNSCCPADSWAIYPPRSNSPSWAGNPRITRGASRENFPRQRTPCSGALPCLFCLSRFSANRVREWAQVEIIYETLSAARSWELFESRNFPVGLCWKHPWSSDYKASFHAVSGGGVAGVPFAHRGNLAEHPPIVHSMSRRKG